MELGARALQQRLNADLSDYAGQRVACPCGRLAHYMGRSPKTFETALSALTLERAYYHCRACRRGFFLRDRACGLVGTTLSRQVLRMLGTLAAQSSFAETSATLAEVDAVEVEAKQVERSAEALGHAIAVGERGGAFAPEPPSAPSVYLGMDGTGVPVCKTEVAGRKGKQADGSARTRGAKLVVSWTAHARNKQGLPMRDAGSVTYSAAIESAASRDTDPFPSDVARRVIIGDRARWIGYVA